MLLLSRKILYMQVANSSYILVILNFYFKDMPDIWHIAKHISTTLVNVYVDLVVFTRIAGTS